MLVIAEILGHGEGRQAHAEPGAGGLVHLAVHHDHVRKHTGGLHIMVELFSFATSLADAAKHAHSLLMPDHVVNHLGEQDGLADPGPPNRPALPPRSRGTSTSMTLMPVSKTSDLVERLASEGGSRWIVRHSTSVGAGWRSMGLPKTSNIREMIDLPTGTLSGPPVSSTAMPRASPSVGLSAIPRT